MRNWIHAALAVLFLGLPAAGALCQDRPPLGEVVGFIDKLYRAESSYALMEMQIITPHWQRTLKLKAWSEGTQKTFIRILEPEKERGMGTLRIGAEMWDYLPKVQKEMRIPPSMMMSSWMGSDFNNDDLVKEFTFVEDYDFRYAGVEDPTPGVLYVECTPKKGKPIVWGRVLLEVDAATYIPITERYFDEKGELMRVMNFGQIKTFGDRRIPSVLELIPQKKEGNKTVIRYLEAQFDLSIPADTFTRRNLRDFRG
jgi:outer membrane lipoprotein-sorting protein